MRGLRLGWGEGEGEGEGGGEGKRRLAAAAIKLAIKDFPEGWAIAAAPHALVQNAAVDSMPPQHLTLVVVAPDRCV